MNFMVILLMDFRQTLALNLSDRFYSRIIPLQSINQSFFKLFFNVKLTFSSNFQAQCFSLLVSHVLSLCYQRCEENAVLTLDRMRANLRI